MNFGEEMELGDNPPSNNSNNSYQNNNNNQWGGEKKQWNNSSGKKQWDNGNKGDWKPKPIEPIEHPEVTVALAVNDDIDLSNIPDSFKHFVRTVNDNNMTVRVNMHSPVVELLESQRVKLEKFSPWKGFNEKEGHDSIVTNLVVAYLHYFFPMTKDMKSGVQKIMGVNLALVLGAFANNRVGTTVIWTQDGVTRPSSTTKQSGYAYSALEIAARFNIPHYNIGDDESMQNWSNWVSRLNLTPQQQQRRN